MHQLFLEGSRLLSINKRRHGSSAAAENEADCSAKKDKLHGVGRSDDYIIVSFHQVYSGNEERMYKVKSGAAFVQGVNVGND